MTLRAFRSLLVAFLVVGVARPAVSAPVLVPRPEVLFATGPKLLVLVAPLDGPSRGQAGLIEHAAETAVGAQGRFTLLRSADALDGRAARVREEAAANARRLDAEGRKTLDDLDAAAAALKLTDALAAWRAADLTLSFKEYVATWAARGGAYASGDENAKARQDIERLLPIAPDAVFSNAWYPPDQLKFAEGLRKQVQAATGELVVRSEPAGARIWVDGTYRGVAPATVKGLAAGKHLVTALLAGKKLWQSEVGLGEELVRLEAAEGAVHWARTLEKVSADPDGPGRDTAARELAAATGAEQVLLLVAKKSVAGNQLDLTALRLEARDGHNASWQQRTVPMDATEGIDALVSALLEKDTPRAGQQPVTHFKGGAGPSPTRKLLGYSLLGAGVALVATGITFGALASGRQAEYRSTLQVETLKAENLAAQGRAFAVVCDVTLITGLVAAAGGAVLGFTTLGQPRAGGAEPEALPAKEKTKGKGKEKAPAPDQVGVRKDEERQKREDDARRAREDEEQKKRDEEERKGKSVKKDKKREADERKKRDEEETRAREEEQRAREEEARKKKEDDERKKKEAADDQAKKKASDDEAKKKEADDRQAREAEEKKRAEDEKKKEEEKKQKAKEEEERKKQADAEKKKKKPGDEPEDHDDLRNF